MSLLALSNVSHLETHDGLVSSLAEGGVTVDLDASLLVPMALFLVLLFVLKPTLFDPMMRLFEEREKRIEGTRRKASKEDEKSAKALAKYEAALAKARETGSLEREKIRAEGAKAEAEVSAEVRSSTQATLDQGRAAIASEARTARDVLKGESKVLGREIASRVLGREVTS